ncbi:AraC family transcriptional regulator [Actinoplanes sp. NBRC 14428]|nr:AraC family transcriptional regulator [Actinoplanes sp. NBRC 14428]
MDTISQAVASLRVGRGTVRRFGLTGSWGLRYSGLTGSGFHIVLRGTGWLLARDAPPVALAPGDIVLVTSGADHGLSATPRELAGLPPAVTAPAWTAGGSADFEFLCGAYRLDRGRPHPYLAALPDLLVLTPDPGGAAALRSIVQLLDDNATDTGPGAAVTRPAVLDLVLVTALRRWLDRRHADGPPAVGDPAVTAVLHTIHADPAARWTVTHLAATVGLSRAALTRRFTAQVGTPPMAYLTTWRLGSAARLLRESEASLAAIARQVGYSTEYAFANAFRRAYGTAPGRFRGAGRAG